MMEPIRLRFTPESNDYSRVMRAQSVRTRVLWLSLAVAFALILIFVWTTTHAEHGYLMLWVTAFIAPLSTAFVLLVWQPYRMRRHVDKQEQLRRETTMEFGESQIVIATGQAETKMGWDLFRKWIETRTDFLLCYSAYRHVVHFVPKRAFESPEQEEAFRALVRSKLPAGHWL